MTIITDIDFTIEQHGTGILQIYVNDNKPTFTFSDGSMHFGQIKEVNNLKIIFNKDDPSDTSSYAIIKDVSINNTDFTEFFKTLNYTVDQTQHPNTEKTIKNNCYFGYIGELTWEFNNDIINIQAKESYNKQLTDNKELSLYKWAKNPQKLEYNKLDHAAWLIATKESEGIIPTYKQQYIENHSTYNVIKNKARYMYSGINPPIDPNMEEYISKKSIKNLRRPINFPLLQQDVINWVKKSNRITLEGIDQFNYMTFTNGVSEFLYSLITRTKNNFGIIDKTYFYAFDLLDYYNVKRFNPLKNIKENQTVLIEFPTLHYDNETIQEILKECKSKNCYIAVDLTLLPIIDTKLSINLNDVDEIYMSMTKTWPIYDIRPAVRFSKKVINDHIQHIQNTQMQVSRIGANLFNELINDYSFDYTYIKYKDTSEKIVNFFNLNKTHFLWLTKSSTYSNIKEHLPSKKYYNSYDFINISRLIENKDKFFW